ncbi:rab-like protein 5-like [Plasmopara halstedii]|uniref:Rab-like protein 5-like n=1 Tax=Plasmopara halstedii TaxID=4781 RepID=A0A0P1B5M5_PLAHL|nr:rab-like protein 5-like [Plasmopara halstedii]CEG49728.1 rab-like protein 5-like [Plasmopara halstedii]|eukprot:XP_024586097.1 rab-like protein 5-like [Plasmopara halstedii]
MAPLKILIVGPTKAGKSTIANFLAEQSDRLGGQERYRPTIGVRILELEKGRANVELWDVSGDQSYEAGWPAVIKETDGVILVYDPESHVHESEAMLWYEWFMQNAGLDSSQCLVLEHSTGSNTSAIPLSAKSRLPSHLRVVATTFDTPNVLKSEFEQLVIAALERQQRMSKRK